MSFWMISPIKAETQNWSLKCNMRLPDRSILGPWYLYYIMFRQVIQTFVMLEYKLSHRTSPIEHLPYLSHIPKKLVFLHWLINLVFLNTGLWIRNLFQNMWNWINRMACKPYELLKDVNFEKLLVGEVKKFKK